MGKGTFGETLVDAFERVEEEEKGSEVKILCLLYLRLTELRLVRGVYIPDVG